MHVVQEKWIFYRLMQRFCYLKIQTLNKMLRYTLCKQNTCINDKTFFTFRIYFLHFLYFFTFHIFFKYFLYFLYIFLHFLIIFSHFYKDYIFIYFTLWKKSKKIKRGLLSTEMKKILKNTFQDFCRIIWKFAI